MPGQDPYQDSNENLCELYRVEHMVVNEIELPPAGSGLKYRFGYSLNSVNPDFYPRYGELNQVTLPSGAVAAYDYFLDGKRRYLGEMRNRLTKKVLQYTADSDGTLNAQTEQWLYGGVYEGATSTWTTTNPDGGIVTYKALNSAGPFYGLIFKVQQPSGDVVERYWARNAPYRVAASDPGNAFVRAEYRTPVNGAVSGRRHPLQIRPDKRVGDGSELAEVGFVGVRPGQGIAARGPGPGENVALGIVGEGSGPAGHERVGGLGDLVGASDAPIGELLLLGIRISY